MVGVRIRGAEAVDARARLPRSLEAAKRPLCTISCLHISDVLSVLARALHGCGYPDAQHMYSAVYMNMACTCARLRPRLLCQLPAHRDKIFVIWFWPPAA